MKIIKYIALVIIALCLNSCNNIKKDHIVVIAHRGASGYLPEHTLPAKALAFGMNPDYIEQDVVLSKDDVPVVIHDIHLETTTNVKQIYPSRCREDGKYYVVDFTWQELQKLFVTERFNAATNQVYYNQRFPIHKSKFYLHTLQEELELIQGLNKSMHKDVGIYVEIKEPQFHKTHQKDISKIVLSILKEYGYSTKHDKCVVQCFDADELRKIREKFKSELFLVQLLEIGYLDEPFKNKSAGEIINQIATYADGIGPWYKQMIAGDDGVDILGFSELVTLAHNKDLKVHAFTFRVDDVIGFNSFEELLAKAVELKVDGIFTDHPDLAINYFKKKNH
ncbi:glycerophosphodiester phosphodiesterase [Wenyingzhuangia sp. IMCC45533]